MTDESFFEIARAIRRQREDEIRCCHVAFIIRKNKILSIGTNKRKTHPWLLKYNYRKVNKGICAELDAVIRCGKESYRDCEMVVVRVMKNGKIMNSRPCIGCTALLAHLEFRNVYFSTDNGTMERME